MGYLGLCKLASSFPIATGSDVGLLSKRGITARCNAQSNFCRHDALYVHRYFVHGLHVYMARHDAVVTEISLRGLNSDIASVLFEKKRPHRRFFISALKPPYGYRPSLLMGIEYLRSALFESFDPKYVRARFSV